MGRIFFKARPCYTGLDGHNRPATKSREVEEPSPEDLALQPFDEPQPTPPPKRSGVWRRVWQELNGSRGRALSAHWDRMREWELRWTGHEARRKSARERADLIAEYRDVEREYE